MLIIASTDLQKEIVEGGRVSHTVPTLIPDRQACLFQSSTACVQIRVKCCVSFRNKRANSTDAFFLLAQGAATIKEFYARNSRWTEGLISAAKAVGWGATEMV